MRGSILILPVNRLAWSPAEGRELSPTLKGSPLFSSRKKTLTLTHSLMIQGNRLVF
jgi:hypothetical protein